MDSQLVEKEQSNDLEHALQMGTTVYLDCDLMVFEKVM